MTISCIIRWIEHQGSTRSSALMRIGVVALLWTEYAAEQRLWKLADSLDLALALLFFVASAGMLLGFFTRVSASLTALCTVLFYYYLGVYRSNQEYVHHHNYLLMMGAVLIACTPCGRSFSVDRYLALRRARRQGKSLPLETGSLWALRLIAMQLAVMYFWAAYDKSFAGFINGDRLEMIFLHKYHGSDYPDSALFPITMNFLAPMTLALEYALAFLVWHPKLKPALLVCGVVFHSIMYFTLPVETFSLTVCLLYIGFLDPAWVHELSSTAEY